VYVADEKDIKKYTNTGTYLTSFADSTAYFNGIDFLGTDENQLMVVVRNRSNPDEALAQIFGPHFKTLNIMNSSWQDTVQYQLITDDLPLLAECDNDLNREMKGVSADGVSPLLLRWRLPADGTVVWSLLDPDDPQQAGGLGTVGDLGQPGNEDSVEVSVENVNGEFIAFAEYTAPSDFDRDTDDHTDTTRTVRITAEFRPASPNLSLAQIKDVSISRPPVAFVHGLWSSDRTWEKFQSIKSPGEGRWGDPILIDYSITHGRRLTVNTEEMSFQLRDAKSDLADSVVTAQFDVVAHSMAGLLLRKFADPAWTGPVPYRRADNMGQGEIHKVLFLNTPHTGSPLADAAVALRDIVFSFWTLPSRKATALVLLSAPKLMIRDLSFGQIIGGAIDDLKTGSSEITNLPDFNEPSHIHAGDASYFWSPQTEPFRYGFAQGVWVFAFWLSMTRFTSLGVATAIITEPSDFVVLEESQLGGLTDPNKFMIVPDIVRGNHFAATSSDSAGILAERWALKKIDDPFFAQSMPAPGSVQQSPSLYGSDGDGIVARSPETDQDSLPDYAGRLIQITSHENGETVHPGQNISVSVQGKGRHTLGGGAVYYPGGALHADDLDVLSQITIPLSHIGPFELFVMGLTGDGRFAISDVITLNVDPAADPTDPPTLESLSVEPEHIVLSGPGDIRQLRVLGKYSDGIERDLSNSALGTWYSNCALSIINVTYDGVVVAVGPGECSLNATNNGKHGYAQITVLDGPQLNNIPVAD
jgi:pimeloyl-ACP methyl ester carboxylesterase